MMTLMGWNYVLSADQISINFFVRFCEYSLNATPTPGTPARIATTTINITIVDGNDNAPQFIGTPYTFSIPESSSTDRTLVVTLNATDLDMGAAGTIRYQLVEGNTELFEINEATVRPWDTLACTIIMSMHF